MAKTTYQGGAAVAQQQVTYTLNDDTDNNETALTMTITNLNTGATDTSSIDPSGQSEDHIASALHAQLTSETADIWTAVTWTVASNVITGTAAKGGVPFSASLAYTGGTGTVTTATVTASSSPSDFAVAANWSNGVPTNTDDAVIAGTDPILYSLNQSSLSLASLRVAAEQRAMIGDPSNSLPLLIDADEVLIEGRGSYYDISGDLDTVTIAYLADGAIARLRGDVDTLFSYGRDVRGTIYAHSSMALDNVYHIGTGSARLVIGTGVTALSSGSIRADSGVIECSSAVGTVNVMACRYQHQVGNLTTINADAGAEVQWNAGDDTAGTYTLTTANIYNSVLTTHHNENSATTIGTINAWGSASTIDISGSCDVTLTNPINQKGGSTVVTTSGTTVSKT